MVAKPKVLQLNRANVELVMRQFPTYACTDLYPLFNAQAPQEKTNVRVWRHRFLKKLQKVVTVTKAETRKLEKSRKQRVKSLQQEEVPSVLPTTIDFRRFTRLCSWPPYKGLHQWQYECHDLTWTAKYDSRTVAREMGKSVLLANEGQYGLQYGDYDILYLGWTDRRKDVSAMIFGFCDYWGLIDKKDSEFHFSLTNGGRFDCYPLRAKEVLGKHSVGVLDRYGNLDPADLEGLDEAFVQHIQELYAETKEKGRKLWIIIDDPIDDSFKDERHKELTLERRFDSTLYPINPDKWSFVGTRKFEGDFFDFIEKKFKEKLVIYKRGPINPDGSLLCPERYTHPSLSTYKKDMRAAKKDLEEIRDAIGEYWWGAEYEQNPHPVTGEVWDKVTYVQSAPERAVVDLICIDVDRATTIKKKSDLTGMTIQFRNSKNGVITVVADESRKYSFEAALQKAEALFEHYDLRFKGARIIVVVEKQGGGDDFISSAKERDFKFAYHIWPPDGVHSTRPKEERIKDYLEIPIKTGRVQFLAALKDSEVIEEIETFPHCRWLDAIDALGTGVREMEKIKVSDVNAAIRQVQNATHKIRNRQAERAAYKDPWDREDFNKQGLRHRR